MNSNTYFFFLWVFQSFQCSYLKITILNHLWCSFLGEFWTVHHIPVFYLKNDSTRDNSLVELSPIKNLWWIPILVAICNTMDTSSSICPWFVVKIPQGMFVFVEIIAILKGESTWKLWHRFNVEISKWFQLSKSTKYRMSSPHEFFYFVSTWNWCNFSTRCFHSIISEYFLLWEPVPCCSDIELSPCTFSDINVITDIGTIVATSFQNFAATQINRNKDNFYFLQSNTNKYYNANLYKYYTNQNF